jgi:hypothetical protein
MAVGLRFVSGYKAMVFMAGRPRLRFVSEVFMSAPLSGEDGKEPIGLPTATSADTQLKLQYTQYTEFVKCIVQKKTPGTSARGMQGSSALIPAYSKFNTSSSLLLEHVDGFEGWWTQHTLVCACP